MTNAFSKEEIVAFEDILQGFEDNEIISKNVSVYRIDDTTAARANDTLWRPQPYILNSVNAGPRVDVSSMYQGATQLSVPVSLSQAENVLFDLDAKELRDQLQDGRLVKSAVQRLASDINTFVADTATTYGTTVIPIATAPGSYDDIAMADSYFNEVGVPMYDRRLFLNSRDYNGLAGNLAAVTRSFTGNKSNDAYTRNYVGPVAGFDTYKLDTGLRLTAQTATVTIATNGTQVRHVPRATQTSAAGQPMNVDNRFQQVTVNSTTGVKKGDAFTIAGIEAVHIITKQPTGQLKTFRVVSVDSGTTMTISPPIIGANSSPTDAELQYKNVEVTSTSATASITWLNKKTSGVNPFWHKDAVLLIPGRYEVPTGQGVAVMKETTSSGVELVMMKHFDQDTLVSKIRVATLYGAGVVSPEQAGVILFNQS